MKQGFDDIVKYQPFQGFILTMLWLNYIKQIKKAML